MADDGMRRDQGEEEKQDHADLQPRPQRFEFDEGEHQLHHLNTERERERHEDRGDDQRSDDSKDRHDAEPACKTPEFMGGAHFASSLSPSRINCLVSAPSPALRAAAAMAAAACG